MEREIVSTKLREGRTLAQYKSDEAVANGYLTSNHAKETIEVTTHYTEEMTMAEADEYAYPDGTVEDSKTRKNWSEEDKAVIDFDVITTEANPAYLTEEEFADKIMQKAFGLHDIEVEAKAAKIRAEITYNGDLQ